MKTFFQRDSLCLCILLALALVGMEVEPWALMLGAVLLAIRAGAERKIWPQPKTLWTNLLSVGALGLVFFQFRTITGQEPSSTFLFLLTCLRILDFQSDRDEKLLIFLGFVLVCIKFLFSLDIYWVPIGALVFLGLWRNLLPKDLQHPWRMTLRNTLRSVPVVALLFFAFPRVQIPWARSWHPQTASVGFSESISPGDIANLAQSKETVMRVEFESFMPPMPELYWRGAVLEVSDGFGWKKTSEFVKEFPVEASGLTSHYTITLEPQFMKVLPVLEHTRILMAPNIRASKTDRSTFKTSSNLNSRVRYSGLSTESWSGPTIKDPLELPPLPPKTESWIAEKRKQKLNYRQKIRLLKDFYLNGNFSYTRSPGKHTDLDDFLFSNRVGFCEHFAGSYALLARGLGIPARVITGYQGGETNDAGNFVRVTQADAHAWVEVREPSGIWKRVDPTYWIAPLRIELGGSSFFQLSPTDFGLSPAQALRKLRADALGFQLWSQTQFVIENLNYLWIRTLLDFDLSEQQKLIAFLAPKMGWWLAILSLLFLVFRFFKRISKSKTSSPSRAAKHYLYIEKGLSKKGFVRSPEQPPLVFLESLLKTVPQETDLIHKTIQLYRFERYKGRTGGPDDWDRLLRGWKLTFKRLTAKDIQGSRSQ